MKIIICDANNDYCNIIEILITTICQKLNISCQITKLNNEHEFLKNINSLNFDVLFIGIKFQTTNGIKLVQKLDYKNKLIIFLTYLNVFELARDSYELNPYKILLKEDIKEIEFLIKDIYNILTNTDNAVVELENKKFNKTKINYINIKNNMTIVTKDETHIIDTKLDYTGLRHILFDRNFISDYTNYFININNVLSIDENKLFFENACITIPFSDIKKIEFYFYSTHKII